MKKALYILAISLLAMACNKKTKFVEITTDYGKIVIELYDETPVHQENFQNLVAAKFYDDLLFHRVIEEFMIQGGDPDSKDAETGVSLGTGGPGYTIPGNFNASDRCFHKKGAVCAARKGDNANPERRSSGSQFYIVQGRSYSDAELTQMEQQKLGRARQSLFNIKAEAYRDTFPILVNSGNREAIDALQSKILDEVDAEIAEDIDKYYMTLEQKEVYQEIGGTPHLDGEYTVFGEVIMGLEVVEQISLAASDKRNRPNEDIKMEMKFVKDPR